MRRLYFRIYLAVLGSLALFAVLVGLSGWVFHELREPDLAGQQPPFMQDVAEHLLPPSASAAALGRELLFWHKRTKFDLALLSPAGEVIALAGSIPDGTLAQFAGSAESKGVHWHPHGAFAIKLDDARLLIASSPPPRYRFLFPLRWLGLVFAIALAVAIGAYPVVRRLTRNIEQLQQGVAAFGQGNLKARVAVRGRDEVGTLAETFNASADRIEALVNAQKRLLANASHELRSPLARLRMAAESIAAPRPNRNRRKSPGISPSWMGWWTKFCWPAVSMPGRPEQAGTSGSILSGCLPKHARRSMRTSAPLRASLCSSRAMSGSSTGCSATCSKTRGAMAALALSRSRRLAVAHSPLSVSATADPAFLNPNAAAFSSPSIVCQGIPNRPGAQGSVSRLCVKSLKCMAERSAAWHAKAVAPALK